MIRITLGILVIIASWTFDIPFSWAVTLTVFSCLVFVQTLFSWVKEEDE